MKRYVKYVIITLLVKLEQQSVLNVLKERKLMVIKLSVVSYQNK